MNDVVLAGGSSRIPRVQQLLEEFFDKNLDQTLHPDQCVAQGAAIAAAKRSYNEAHHKGGLSEIVIIDAVPMSLGVQLSGGRLGVLIKKNTQIPCDGEREFVNDASNKATIGIEVFQGDRKDGKEGEIPIAECDKIGDMFLTGFGHYKAGEGKVKVKFNVDSNGMLKVTALDMAQGQEKTMEVVDKLKLTEG